MSRALDPGRESATSLGAARAQGRAFGLDLDAAFDAPGLLDGRSGAGTRRASIELVAAPTLDSHWSRQGSVRLHELKGRDGRLLLTIDEDPEFGYRLSAPDYGHYSVSRDGSLVLCAPSASSPWHWQSFLIGQMLPAAAVLHGLEVLHASAVALDGQAVVVTGPSGAGKSSLAVNLLRLGAGFLADDVVALESAGEHVLVHSGPALVSVRHAEARALGTDALSQLGPEMGRDDHEVRVRVRRDVQALPLGAVYFIERGGPAAQPTFTRASDPRLLIGSCFTKFVQAPDRLINQLDVYARTQRTAAVFKVVVPSAVNAITLAGQLRLHALSVFG